MHIIKKKYMLSIELITSLKINDIYFFVFFIVNIQ